MRLGPASERNHLFFDLFDGTRGRHTAFDNRHSRLGDIESQKDVYKGDILG